MKAPTKTLINEDFFTHTIIHHMKKKMILILALFISTTTSMMAQSIDDLFNEFKDKPNVEYIDVPKAMMGFAASSIKEEKGADLMKEIDSIRILSMENNNEQKTQFEQRVKALTKKHYEQMVNSNDDGEKAQILVKTKGESITEMLIICIDNDECALVQICGKIRPEDIQKLQSIAH